jgi:RHS repeat-associated protein
LIQSRTISKIHYTITSPFRGSRDGVVSAKEKDEETSYSYFGARYLESGFSFWFSVDPKCDKFPYISAYNYCNSNPLAYKDKEGEKLLAIIGAIVGGASENVSQTITNGDKKYG